MIQATVMRLAPKVPLRSIWIWISFESEFEKWKNLILSNRNVWELELFPKL